VSALRFQVEFVMAERGYLIARALEPRSFRLVEGTTLGGCPVEPRHLDIPRARSAGGEARQDLFAFRLKRREDAARFRPGDLAELADWR
jgi:hypothetical protein